MVNRMLKITIEKAYEKIIDGIGAKLDATPCDRIVIGLSGGIDSAVVCCLAVEAVSKENVIGVSMPSMYSDDSSHSDAKELADNLGVELVYISINRAYNRMLKDLQEGAKLPKTMCVAWENLQARIRMTYLFAIANHRNGIVLDTGNATELWLGYCTLYGDLAGAISPCSMLNKMEIYDMAGYINKRFGPVPPIPEHTFARTPSAELCENQRDPFDYEIMSPLVDELAIIEASLGNLKTAHGDIYDILCKKYSQDNVDVAIGLIMANKFKRDQAPSGIDLW